MAWVDDVDYVSNGSMQKRGLFSHESSGYFYEKPYKETSYRGGLEPEIPNRKTKRIKVTAEAYPDENNFEKSKDVFSVVCNLEKSDERKALDEKIRLENLRSFFIENDEES